jgi:hypothetical protein
MNSINIRFCLFVLRKIIQQYPIIRYFRGFQLSCFRVNYGRWVIQKPPKTTHKSVIRLGVDLTILLAIKTRRARSWWLFVRFHEGHEKQLDNYFFVVSNFRAFVYTMVNRLSWINREEPLYGKMFLNKRIVD